MTDIYSKASIAISNTNGKTPYIKVTRGLLQGEPLSPLLFALFLSDLETFMRENGIRGVQMNHLKEVLLLGYADDLAFFADSPVQMRKILLVLQKYCKLNLLTVNVRKTKIMVFHKGGFNVNEYKFFYENETLEVVKSYKFLGVEFFHSGNHEFTSNQIISKTLSASGIVLSLINRMKIDSWPICKKLFDSLISSVLLYAASTWSINYLDKVEKVQTSFLKKMFTLPNNTPGHLVRLETGTTHTAVRIFEDIINWIYNLTKMNDERYPKICFLRLKELALRFPSSEPRYNWIIQIRKNFLDKINVNIQDVFSAIKSQSYRDFLVEKMRRAYLQEDLERSYSSNALFFAQYLNYDNSTPRYFVYFTSIKTLKTISQLRLLNKYNERLIIKNKLLKAEKNGRCYFCGTQNNIFHMINECPRFIEERNKAFGPFSDFVSNIVNVSGSNVKITLSFIEELATKIDINK